MASRASRARARAARPPPPPRPPAPAPTGSRGRRPLLLLLGGWRLAGGGEPRAAAVAEAASIAAWTAEGLAGDTEGGWTAAPGDAGVLYRVVEPGAGDAEAGVFDPPAAFKTFPFVSVRFSVYGTDGTLVDSTEARGKASWDYQVGIRQALEDELGGVNDMVVGERRQFVVTEDTVLENIGGGKLFGVKLPPGKSVLVDVRLLKIRPY